MEKVKRAQMTWIVTRNYVIYSASFKKGGGGNKWAVRQIIEMCVLSAVRYKVQEDNEENKDNKVKQVWEDTPVSPISVIAFISYCSIRKEKKAQEKLRLGFSSVILLSL